jgi:hypothetical protein
MCTKEGAFGAATIVLRGNAAFYLYNMVQWCYVVCVCGLARKIPTYCRVLYDVVKGCEKVSPVHPNITGNSALQGHPYVHLCTYIMQITQNCPLLPCFIDVDENRQ